MIRTNCSGIWRQRISSRFPQTLQLFILYETFAAALGQERISRTPPESLLQLQSQTVHCSIPPRSRLASLQAPSSHRRSDRKTPSPCLDTLPRPAVELMY